MKLFDVAITRREPDAVHVVLSGDLDLSTLDQLKEALDGRLDGGADLVVLDLRELTFLDSSGLRLILGLQAGVDEGGGRLVLVKGPRRVHRVLELTRADEELEIVADPDEIDADPRQTPAKRDISAEAG